MLVPALDSLGPNLVHLIWEAAVVGIAVIFAFSVALTATIRATDARTGGRRAALVSWFLVALLAYGAFATCAVLAIHVVTKK